MIRRGKPADRPPGACELDAEREKAFNCEGGLAVVAHLDDEELLATFRVPGKGCIFEALPARLIDDVS